MTKKKAFFLDIIGHLIYSSASTFSANGHDHSIILTQSNSPFSFSMK